MSYPEQLLAVIAADDEASKGALLATIEAPTNSWTPPPAPARPGRAATVREGQPPRRRRGINDPHGRLRFLHAIWHIELTAIDLCCLLCLRAPEQPAAFHRDHLAIAREEAIHAALLRAYLSERGYPPGSEAVHFRLWDTACTVDDIGEQLVVIPRFLEARGLDVTAELLPRLERVDADAHAVCSRIYQDEIGHVEIGTRWHRAWCAEHDIDPLDHFRQISSKYFADQIPGAFTLDRAGRTEAGFWPAEIDHLEGEPS
ncbi:MAG: DUF455 family protein [Planctomycetota bacterium]|jgi:uncharacterized ferritin-like protein (DUF455 family)